MKSNPIVQVDETLPVGSFSDQVLTVMRSFRKSQKILSGAKMRWLELRIRLTIAAVAWRRYRKVTNVLSVLRSLDALRRRILGPHRITKLAVVDGKCYWDLYTPGWPSPHFDQYFAGEMHRMIPQPSCPNRFNNIILAITKKCPLACEHCFEWDSLNGKERLRKEDIRKLVKSFQKMGTTQIQLSGGEPMLRVADMAEIVSEAHRKSDFWVLTSGFNLSYENARLLKQAGLTGVVVSLDHYDPEEHNRFRGMKNAFDWAQRAVKSAIEANLVTALSLCVTRSFAEREHLFAYARLAKEMGVSFIQVLEPKAVGHYAGKSVSLDASHYRVLEDFYFQMNYDPAFADFPIVTYHGYHQRTVGCFSGGNRNLYVDTDGDLHACPFCQEKKGSALSPNLDELISQLQTRGCHSFASFSN